MMKRMGLSFLGFALGLTACAGDEVGSEPESPLASTSPSPSSSPSSSPPSAAPSPTPAPPSQPVTIGFAGDTHFEGSVADLLNRPEANFKGLRSVVGKPDFTMGNLESALSTGGKPSLKELETPSNRYHFRTDGRALRALAAGGFDLLSMANNHGGDYGVQGLRDSLRIEAQGGMPIVGIGQNRQEAFEPHREELSGQAFSFFAADASKLESRNPVWQAGAQPGLAFARGEGEDYLVRQVRMEVEQDRTVVLYLHWGDEDTSCPSPRQEELAKRLSEAGAAAIVGSHSHRLMGSGWLEDTYVAYGLGNFIWYHGRQPLTGLLTLTFKDGRVSRQALDPAMAPVEGGLPRFTEGVEKSRSLETWRRLRNCAGLTAKPEVAAEPLPSFNVTVTPAERMRASLEGSSWRPACPVGLEGLSHLRLRYVDFNGAARWGELIVADDEAKNVSEVFKQLYRARFPIAKMKLVDEYGGQDSRSMAANNTSGFNCRLVAGTNNWSDHSYGRAIDVNPVQNPYVRSSGVEPRRGAAFADLDRSRSNLPKGVVGNNSVVVRAYDRVGWEWGNEFQDYQHFFRP